MSMTVRVRKRLRASTLSSINEIERGERNFESLERERERGRDALQVNLKGVFVWPCMDDGCGGIKAEN